MKKVNSCTSNLTPERLRFITQKPSMVLIPILQTGRVWVYQYSTSVPMWYSAITVASIQHLRFGATRRTANSNSNLRRRRISIPKASRTGSGLLLIRVVWALPLMQFRLKHLALNEQKTLCLSKAIASSSVAWIPDCRRSSRCRVPVVNGSGTVTPPCGLHAPAHHAVFANRIPADHSLKKWGRRRLLYS